jgi:hypothetical protein
MLAIASLASLSLTGPGAFAQATQLDASIAVGLADLGIDTETIGILSDAQVAQIENVLSSSDDETRQSARIERILASGAPGSSGGLGVAQLQDSVSSEMARLGIDTSMVTLLDLDRLAQIENAVASSDDDEQKRERIERIIDVDTAVAAPLGVSQLRDSVTAEMAKLGIDTSRVSMLNLGKVAEIENIVSSSDADETKRQRIEVIFAQ